MTVRPESRGAPILAQRGFTLVELAIVLFIVTLLLGGMLLPLSAQQDIRARQETEKVLGETRDALLGYVVVNGRLPCPDTDADGAENGSAGACTAQEGDFPYQTVGTTQSDGWGYRLRYRVSSAFSSTISLSSAGDITVITRGDNPATVGTTETKSANNLVTTAPAVILAVGKNGFGGRPAAGGTATPVPAINADEVRNNSGSTKVNRNPTSVQATCSDTAEGSPFCEFDDQLVWLSSNTIFNRLVAAGKL